MFYTYVGEELIWKLRANNPYEQNSARGVYIRFQVENAEEANAIESFLKKHIDAEHIEKIEETKYSKIIPIKNVFGNVSRVVVSWI